MASLAPLATPMCTRTSEDGDMTGAFTLCSFKRGATGAEVLFIIGLGAGKFLVLRRTFSRISLNFPEKFFVQLLPTNSLPQRSLFVGVTSKKGLHVFLCKHWEPLFEIKQCPAPFIFTQIFKYVFFQQIKTFGGEHAPPAPTPQTPLLFITVS